MEDMQKKYMEYQMLDQRIKQMQEQLQMVDQQTMEAMATLQSIDEFSKLQDKSEILVPINNGIFAKATLKKEEKLRVNIGSAVVVDKTVQQTKKLIEKQTEQIAELREKIIENLNQLVQQAANIEKSLTKNV